MTDRTPDRDSGDEPTVAITPSQMPPGGPAATPLPGEEATVRLTPASKNAPEEPVLAPAAEPAAEPSPEPDNDTDPESAPPPSDVAPSEPDDTAGALPGERTVDVSARVRTAEPASESTNVSSAEPVPGDSRPETATDDKPRPSGLRRSIAVATSGSALIAVLLALFGFVLVVQLRGSNADESLNAARQEDLVRILSDLEAREQRLDTDISDLNATRQQLESGAAGRQAALADAEERANELGLLAGTLPARGSGLLVTIAAGSGAPIKAASLLNAVQELRGAQGEVIQLAGADGHVVRVVASTAFVDADGGAVSVGGTRLAGPYQLTVIGAPTTMATALKIAGGVVASIESGGGTVTLVERDQVEVTATRQPADLQYARPVS